MADDKYITFKRADFIEWLTRHPAESTLPWEQIAMQAAGEAEALALDDAVVIRRQDLFASPALAGYAAAIAIATRLIDDDPTRKRLLAVADYFERQAQLAAEEGWKLPDV